MWAYCLMRWWPWWHITWKRLRYWMPPSSQSLLARLTFRNPMSQRPGWKPEEMELPLVEDYQVSDKCVSKLVTHKSTGTGGIHLWMMKELADIIMSLLSIFINPGNWEKYLRTSEKQISLPPPRTASRRTVQASVGLSASPQFLGRWWSTKS